MPQNTAVVIATFSRRMRLRLPGGSEVEARIKGKRLKPVCGDRVLAESISNESDWLITAILDRDNVLSRPNLRGQVEVLAANIDLLVAVAASTPQPDWYIVDRYLCAAELMGTTAAVVYNKIDLGAIHPSAQSTLTEYAAIGSATVKASATTGAGMDELAAILNENVAIVVGQSGVGKSTIINHLTGIEQQRTAAVSEKRGAGRHTTVNSVMRDLPRGGSVIDSPGVRDYAPALDAPADVSRGFRDIQLVSRDCNFNNCRHRREPGCAVKQAVADGRISRRRYDSYRRLLSLTEELTAKRR